MRPITEEGFTLVETLIVTLFMAVVFGSSMVMVNKAVESSRAETALQTVTMQLRLARELAMDSRRVHSVTFTSPRTITIVRREIGGNPDVTIAQLNLPSYTQFYHEVGISQVPDNFSSTEAVDFNGFTTVFFNPDGTAVDNLGTLCNGIVYVSNPGKLSTFRAVTLFGATGRVKGFRYQTDYGTWG
jgi:Tfp pilus assembly protein FimT